MNKFNLSNRVAIVTGGAQGFGLAISERFIQSDAKVIIFNYLAYNTYIKRIHNLLILTIINFFFLLMEKSKQ